MRGVEPVTVVSSLAATAKAGFWLTLRIGADCAWLGNGHLQPRLPRSANVERNP
jgi:hypothetical protein